MSTDIILFVCMQNISIFKSCWNTFKSYFLGGSGEEETGGVSVIGRNLEKYAEKVGESRSSTDGLVIYWLQSLSTNT